MKKLLFAFVLLFPVSAYPAGYSDEIAKFFELYEKGQKVEAVDSIYSTNPWMGSAADSIHNIKIQLQGIEKVVGNYNGVELIGEYAVKDRFVHVTYLALYDRQPVRMEFQFYRPKDDWIIYSFAFDIDFDNEIEQGARAQITTDR